MADLPGKPPFAKRGGKTPARTRLSEALDAVRATRRAPSQDSLVRAYRDDVLAEFRADPQLTIAEMVTALHGLDPRIKRPACARAVGKLLQQQGLGRRRANDAAIAPDRSADADRPPARSSREKPAPSAPPADESSDDLLSQIRR